MTDQDRFDQRLSDRLRAAEERTPGAAAPGLPQPADRRRWAPLATVGAAGLLAAAVLVGILIQPPAPPAGGGTPSPTASATAVATLPSPTASSTPSATAAPSGTLVPSVPPSGPWASGTIEAPPASNFGPYFNGVRWFSGIGWLAFGQDGSATPGEGGPVLWHSDDGLTWARAEVPTGLAGYGVRDVEVAALAGGPRLAAVASDYHHSAILVSSDGVSWELAATPAAGAVLNAVAHGDAGFVAVGTDRDPSGIDVSSGVVWRSPDGLAWQASTPAALDGAVPVTIQTITDAGYVALGWLDGEAPPRTLAWTSLDGVSWQSSVVRPAQSGGGSLGLISASNGSLMVAAGVDPDAYAAMSTGGLAWTFESLPEPQADPIAVDISSQAIVMVAFVYVADGPSATLVWVRDLPDGTWRTVDWHSQVDAPDEFVGTAGVAIGPDRTLIMFSNGRVLLTGGPLP